MVLEWWEEASDVCRILSVVCSAVRWGFVAEEEVGRKTLKEKETSRWFKTSGVLTRHASALRRVEPNKYSACTPRDIP